MGGQFRVEDQLLGQVARALLPELDEAEDLVVLFVLAQLTIGIAEHTGVGVLGEESQDPLLLAAPLGNVVFFDQRVFPVEGNRMEVQVEGIAPRQPQTAHGIEPASHQLRVAGRINAATVLREKGTLGNHVQPGEQGQSFVQHGTHDVAVAGGAEEFQPQQRAHRTACGNHLRAGQVGLGHDAVERDRRQPRQEQEQAAKMGLDVPGCQVELAHVGRIGQDGACRGGTLIIASPRESCKPFLLQQQRDRHGTEGMSSLAKAWLMS